LRLVFPTIHGKILASKTGQVFVSFSIAVRQTEDVSIVDVSGRLTSFESRAFQQMIQTLLKQGHTNIVLNLTALEYLDSSGVGELVRNYLSVVKKGGAMKVVGLAPKIEEVLKITQLYQVFPEFPDEASALESFSGIRTTSV
jgi:anti-sigma B factor antagonist